MKIEKHQIAGKLAKLKSILPKNPTIEALKGVLLSNDTLTASDLEITVTMPLGLETHESFIIPEKAIELIEELPNGIVEIACKDKDTVHIKMGKISNRFKTYSVGDYPNTAITPQGDNSETIIDGSQLTIAIKSILYAVAEKPPSPTVLEGILFENDGENLNLVASNACRLAVTNTQCDNKINLIIHKNAIDKLLKFGLDEETYIDFDENHIAFKSSEYCLFTRLLSGKFVDYKRLMTVKHNDFIISRTQFTDCLIRACICVDSKEKSAPLVVLTLKDKVLSVSTREGINAYTEEIDVEVIDAPNFKMAFNARYIVECLKSYSCEKVRFGYTGEHSPAFISDIEYNKLQTMVVPVRLI